MTDKEKDLLLFARFVLQTMERDKDWLSDDTLGSISDAAYDMGLACSDKDGSFKAIL